MTKLRILVLHRQNSAVGYYRQWCKARMLERLGHEVTWWEDHTYHRNLKPRKGCDIREWPEQWFREHINEFDLIFTDRETQEKSLKHIAAFKHYNEGCRMIVDFDDDFTCVPDWNYSHGNYNPGQEPYRAALQHMRLAEMTTVSTEALVERFRLKTHEIRYLPNYIDPTDWADLALDPSRGQDDHLRVLYGGAASHYGDVTVIRSTLEELIVKQPVKWRLICFGSLPEWLYDLGQKAKGKVVALPWIPFKDYPQAIAWGGFDMGIAPLAAHPFNEAKSKIKWLEAGIQGIPLIVSKIGPYATIPPGCAIRVANTHQEWSEALLSFLTDPALREMYQEEAFEMVKKERSLDSGLKRLQNIVEEVMALPRIETLEQTRLASDPIEVRPMATPPLGSPESPPASVRGSCDQSTSPDSTTK